MENNEKKHKINFSGAEEEFNNAVEKFDNFIKQYEADEIQEKVSYSQWREENSEKVSIEDFNYENDRFLSLKIPMGYQEVFQVSEIIVTVGSETEFQLLFNDGAAQTESTNTSELTKLLGNHGFMNLTFGFTDRNGGLEIYVQGKNLLVYALQEEVKNEYNIFTVLKLYDLGEQLTNALQQMSEK